MKFMEDFWVQQSRGDSASMSLDMLARRVEEQNNIVVLLQILNRQGDLKQLYKDLELFFQNVSGVDRVQIIVDEPEVLPESTGNSVDSLFKIDLFTGGNNIGSLCFSTTPAESLQPHLYILAAILATGIESNINTQKLIIRDQQLVEFVDQLPFGIISIGRKGNIRRCNESGFKITGYSSDEVIGKHFLRFVPRKKRLLRGLAKAIHGHVSYFETFIKLKSGELLEVSVQVLNPEPFYTIVVIKDITEDKNNTRELLKAKGNAEAANRAKSEFLANMSHEIRTPLNGVIGFAELLSITELSDVQKHYVDNLVLSANTLLELINNVLDFSKIEAGKLELRPARGNIVSITEGVADMLKYNAHRKGVEFILNIQPGIHSDVVIDELRFRQVLMNLISNAIKFTDNGEVEVSLREKSLDLNRSECIYHVSVRDTGIGISENDRKKLFKNFSQVNTAYVGKVGGTGLGLVISGLLLHKMGTEIKLSSTPGMGSTFSFDLRLPVYNAEAELRGPALKAIKNTLLVGNNLLSRSVISEMLRFKGMDVQEASDGVEAVMCLDSDSPVDFIIVDFNMPVINGIEMVRRIRASEGGKKRTPILVLFSSFDDVNLQLECKSLGVHRMLKPVKISELYQVLYIVDEFLLDEREPN
jgi:PAS domain S-box-containing protein